MSPCPTKWLQEIAPTPIKINVLKRYLQTYPNRADRFILLNGFTFGFRLGYTGPRITRDSPCLKSARGQPDIVLAKLLKEREKGRIAGPFYEKPLPNLQCSPLGLVPKKQPGEYRLIHHLSYPNGASINDFIDDKLCKVKYSSFDDAISMISELNGQIFLGKLDIKSAFRLLPVNPLDFDLLGFRFNSCWWVDRCVPMGCAISCSLFEKFSSFLEYHVKTIAGEKVINIRHYLDDYVIASSSRDECDEAMQLFAKACDELGVPIAHEKTEGPSQVITYLGLEIDTQRKQVRVPQDKLISSTQSIDNALALKKLTLQKLQSLIGSLSFLCKAVSPGRAFLRRLINLTRGVARSHHKIRITGGAKEDLLMWKKFLTNYNGITYFQSRYWVNNDKLQLFTDAAGSIGFGLFFQGRWSQGRWPTWVLDKNFSIAVLELFPIYVAIKLWGQYLANTKVCFRSDNQATVGIINKQTSPCKIIMRMVREIVLTCLLFNISFKARYIEGKHNDIADFLSRFQMQKFRQVAPHALPQSDHCPPHMWDVLK